MDVYFVGGEYASPQDRAKVSYAESKVDSHVFAPQDGSAPFK